MLSTSAVNGKLSVSHSRGGEIWMQGGEVVHALALSREGEDALDVLASVRGGEFSFDPSPRADTRTIQTRRNALLRQLSVNSDAWQELLAIFPNWEAPLIFTPRWTEQQPVTRAQFRVLDKVGKMPLLDLVSQSELAPRATLELLRPFVQAGIIDAGAAG